MRLFERFWRDRSGATVLEYAFIAGIISVGLIASFTAIGTNVANKFPSISDALN